MNEKPQEVREDEQEDILEQIITQGLDRMRVPVQTVDAGEPPSSETPPASKQEAAPLTVQNNRRSAVYLYLLILFGAAFLMLLLAYFIQRRSSEDLRDSMNLSRDELLTEIRELEAQIAALEEENNTLDHRLSFTNAEFKQLQTQYEEKDGELSFLWTQFYDMQEQLHSWGRFWELEQYYQAGDYEACAAVLIMRGQGDISYHTPGDALERDDEIIQAVIGAGYLKEDFRLHPDDYWDLVESFLSRSFASVPSGFVSRET